MGTRTALEQRLRDAIRSGQLAEGARLPSSRAYAEELGVSRGTVTAAFDQLVAEGYLVARPGAGTHVAAVRMARAAGAAPPSAAAARLNLRPGSPDVQGFPVAAWLRATRRALNAAPYTAFGYGDPRGQTALRHALADYLSRARGVVTSADQIVVTTSYAQALSLLATVLCEGGGAAIGMEDPCLPYHRELVRRAGAAVAAVPVDGLGLVPAALDGLDAVVTTAAHQYPTGVTLAPPRRAALTRWAQESGGVIIEDDYDGEFRYDRQPIGSLQGTAPDQVAYVGTVAKTLGPGLRIGWVALPPSLVRPVIEAKRCADHHTDSLSQLTLAELLTSHAYDRHVRAMRLRYRRRRDLLVERLGEVGGGIRLGGVSAGLQTLVLLPPGGPTEDEVITAATAHGLAVDGLAEHRHQPGEQQQGLLVGFGAPTESAYPAALSALCTVLRRALG